LKEKMQKTKFKQTEIGMIPADWELTRFQNALRIFLKNERFLLVNNLNERTISHKLAEYLQRECAEYNVDCEYNRMERKNGQAITYTSKELDLPIVTTDSEDTEAKTVFPDIIVHKRGTNENNFLVIEIKKSTNSVDRKFDCNKLKAFTSQLGYQYGIFIEFDQNGVSHMKFFRDGEEVVNEEDAIQTN